MLKSIKNKKTLCLIFALFLSVVTVILVPAVLEIKLFLGIVVLSCVLWAFEIFPLSYTGLLIILLLILSKILNLDEALKGFGSGVFLLLVSGFIIARGINSTNLGKRVSFFIIKQVGSSVYRLMLAIILIPQILVLFIPSTGVRTVIMLPFVLSIIKVLETNDKDSVLPNVLMLSLVFGCNLSGMYVLTGAIANVVTVDFISNNMGIVISYTKWLLLAFPIWFFSLLISIILLKKFVLGKNDSLMLNSLVTDIALPKMDKKEKKSLFILLIILVLWATQDYHGLHPSVPALLGALLMTLPVVGVIDWNEAIKINWGTVLLIGSALAVGNALQISGADKYLAEHIISIKAVETLLKMSWSAPFIIAFLTIILHLGIASHVSTAVVVLPIVYEMGNALSLSSTSITGLLTTSGIASLIGFTFIVQSPPAIIAYGTGYLKAKDLLFVGTLLSIFIAIILSITVILWWPVVFS